MITAYISRKHSIKSTYKFLELISNIDVPGKLASIDVEGVFTNVLVKFVEEISEICINFFFQSTDFHKMIRV